MPMAMSNDTAPNYQHLYLNALAPDIASCVQRKDTNHPVFHGCIDWHSATHGHWALLRLSRTTNNHRWLRLVKDSMNAEAMALERALLNERPGFEMPYGRAWFLLLMEEYEKATGSKTYRAMADEVAESLFEYLGNKVFNPHIGEYDNQSWAYLRLFRYYQHVGETKRIIMLRKRIADSAIDAPDFGNDSEPGFFSVYGNYLHLLQQMDMHDRLHTLLAARPISDEQLKPIKHLQSNHHLSINYSRAWALSSLYETTGKQRYLDAYEVHIRHNFNLPKNIKDDYLRYGHWVPQFGIYAITERYANSIPNIPEEN
ncbi:MAG: DUF2891 domain-containing protein [Porticoccaceae bacterium]|nr:DUF2891 domain-containing protein [Porticoccaceae bacterium]